MDILFGVLLVVVLVDVGIELMPLPPTPKRTFQGLAVLAAAFFLARHFHLLGWGRV